MSINCGCRGGIIDGRIINRILRAVNFSPSCSLCRGFVKNETETFSSFHNSDGNLWNDNGDVFADYFSFLEIFD